MRDLTATVGSANKARAGPIARARTARTAEMLQSNRPCRAPSLPCVAGGGGTVAIDGWRPRAPDHIGRDAPAWRFGVRGLQPEAAPGIEICFAARREGWRSGPSVAVARRLWSRTEFRSDRFARVERIRPSGEPGQARRARVPTAWRAVRGCLRWPRTMLRCGCGARCGKPRGRRDLLGAGAVGHRSAVRLPAWRAMRAAG